MTNYTHTTLYVGVTSQLFVRVRQHQTGYYPKSFTARYKCHKLIYYEMHRSIQEAIVREKNIKKWRRSWKESLIQKINPSWADLTQDIENL